MYITIEGIDTSGKSTQISLLKQHFKQANFIKEPNRQEIYNLINEYDNKSQAFLFLADRLNQQSNIITNDITISDRSLVSGIAYATSLNLEWFFNLHMYLKINIPTLIIILQIDKINLINRLNSKNKDNIESQAIDILMDIQQRIIDVSNILMLKHQTKIKIIDALKSPQNIHDDIKKEIYEIQKNN